MGLIWPVGLDLDPPVLRNRPCLLAEWCCWHAACTRELVLFQPFESRSTWNYSDQQPPLRYILPLSTWQKLITQQPVLIKVRTILNVLTTKANSTKVLYESKQSFSVKSAAVFQLSAHTCCERQQHEIWNCSAVKEKKNLELEMFCKRSIPPQTGVSA